MVSLGACQRLLMRLWGTSLAQPWSHIAAWCEHIPREWNQLADQLANVSEPRQYMSVLGDEDWSRMRGFFDGSGGKGQALACLSWVLQTFGQGKWRTCTAAAVRIMEPCTPVYAELLGARLLLEGAHGAQGRWSLGCGGQTRAAHACYVVVPD